MHALGIPTTRALAVVATGDHVARETLLPGAVLVRVAASHVRVGTFEYAARLQDTTVLPRLADYAIARHHPEAADAERPALALLERVVEAQAALLAQWMLVGFVHGVMNTDNMTISGETIDYGPCAFIDGYDPATVFSSIDHAGRYAYGNQPAIAQWNLARLAETLLRLIDPDPEAAIAPATAVLDTFPARYQGHYERGLRAKLGLDAEAPLRDPELLADLPPLLVAQRADFTMFFRTLAGTLRGAAAPAELAAWIARWRGEVTGGDPAATADAMDRVNPIYIPRNHHVEDALTAATTGDLAPYERLLAVVSSPYEARPGLEDHAGPAPAAFAGGYQTFCGT
ncbi:MAG: YdiU family protein, partial [Conexibacter sp.]|nr:YdiU family protein [Conexibacter sp.]